MSTDDNKRIYRDFIERGFNNGELSALDELLAPGYVNHDAPPGMSSGADGVKQIITMFRGAFPDLHIAMEDQVAEGDLVSTRSLMSGTHEGTLFGIAPTQNRVQMPGLTMVRVRDGKIVEAWVKNDTQSLMRQIGAP
jgi:predicted ester cyclase